MPSFTKKAIVESFLRLAGKKPLDKITVRDIVDDCGINRNTFYYHFQDIYAVLEAVCLGGTAGVNTALPLGEMLAELFSVLTAYAERHHKAVQGSCRSGYERSRKRLGKSIVSPLYRKRSREYSRGCKGKRRRRPLLQKRGDIFHLGRNREQQPRGFRSGS